MANIPGGTVTENALDIRLADLEGRIAALEARLPKSVPNENDAADAQHILQLIRENPGMSQRGISVCAKHYHQLSRARTVEVLRRMTGELWTTEAGAWRSLLYFAIGDINAVDGTTQTTDVAAVGANRNESSAACK
jgi:hypothetical protein